MTAFVALPRSAQGLLRDAARLQGNDRRAIAFVALVSLVTTDCSLRSAPADARIGLPFRIVGAGRS